MKQGAIVLLFAFACFNSVAQDTLSNSNPKFPKPRRYIFEIGYPIALDGNLKSVGSDLYQGFNNNDMPYSIQLLRGRNFFYWGLGHEQYTIDLWYITGVFGIIQWRVPVTKKISIAADIDFGIQNAFQRKYAANNEFLWMTRIQMNMDVKASNKLYLFGRFGRELGELTSFSILTTGVRIILNEDLNTIDTTGWNSKMKYKWTFGMGVNFRLMPSTDDSYPVFPMFRYVLETRSDSLYRNGIGALCIPFPNLFMSYTTNRLVQNRIEFGSKVFSSEGPLGVSSEDNISLSESKVTYQYDRPVFNRRARASNLMTVYAFFGGRLNLSHKNYFYINSQSSFGIAVWSVRKFSSTCTDINNSFFLQLPIGLRTAKNNFFLDAAFNIGVLAGVSGENNFHEFYWYVDPDTDGKHIYSAEKYGKIYFPKEHILNELAIKIGCRF